jgi:ATP-dependent helicase/nuclease subunit B
MLNLITGRQGTGKSRYIYEQIAKDIKGKKRVYLLIPEQYSFQAEKEIIDILDTPGMMGIHVLSFSRLAYQLLNKASKMQKQPLSKKAALIVLKKILIDVSPNLTIYSKSWMHDGLGEMMLGCIGEFKKNQVKPNQLISLGESKLLDKKIREIMCIYDAYENYINRKFYDAEDLIEQASEEIIKEDTFKDTYVYIDGFYTLDKQRLAMLEHIFSQAASTTVAIRYEEEDDRDIFSITEKFKKDIIQIAKCNRIKINNIHFHKKKNTSKPILHIEENIFKYRFKKYISTQNEELPQVYVLNDMQQEAAYTAQKILSLMQTKDLRYKDIAVFTNDLEAYAPYLQKAFDDVKIPYFIDDRHDIKHNCLVRMIFSFLSMMQHGSFYYRDVFEFLKTGFSTLSDEEINLFENYVLKYGIKKEQYFKEFLKADTKDKNKLKEINDIREKFACQIKGWYERSKSLKTYDQIADFIYYVIDSDAVISRVNENITFCEENELFVESSIEQQIIRIIKESLEFINYFLKDQPATLEEFYQVFRQSISSENAGVLPIASDCIMVGDFARSRISNIKVAVIIGATEGNMPKKVTGEGIFTQKEKQILTEKGLDLAGELKGHIAKERFYIYSILSEPKENLILTAPLSDDDAQTLELCAIAQQICAMFGTVPLPIGEKDFFITTLEGTYQSLVTQLSQSIQNKTAPDKVLVDLFCLYSQNAQYEKRIELIKKAMQFDNATEQLSKEDIRAVKSNPFIVSASNMSTYAHCPFKYFMQYTLKPQKRELWEINALDIGNLMHSTGEEFTEHILQNHIDLKTVTNEEIEEIIEKIIEKNEQEFKNGVFESDKLNSALFSKAKQVAKKTISKMVEHINASEFAIAGSEIEFGEGKSYPPIPIANIDGIDVNVEGKIDRVDTFEQNGITYFKVFDYKTGNINLDYTKIYYGLDLQLNLYMLSCLRSLQKSQPAGMFYYKFAHPIIKYNNEVGSGEALADKINEEMRYFGIAVNDDDIIMAIDKNAKDDKTKACSTISYKANSQLKESAHVFSPQEMQRLLKHSAALVEKFVQEILSGQVAPNPYKSSCTYCPYKKVCNFDHCFEKNYYKKMDKVNKKNIIEKIKGCNDE